MKKNETLCVGDGGKGRGERGEGRGEKGRGVPGNLARARERTSCEKIHRTKSKRRYEE